VQNAHICTEYCTKAAGGRPDPLGKLTVIALPRSPSWHKGEGQGGKRKGQKKEGREEGEGRGKEGRGSYWEMRTLSPLLSNFLATPMK